MSSEAAYFPNALSGATDVGRGSPENKLRPESKAPEIAAREAPIFDVSDEFLPIESSEEKLSGKVDEASGESSDEFLLAQTANGSRDALGLLFRRHRRAVWSVATRILRDETEAEDLCQEVFILLFQRAKAFDSSRGTASSWIIQIAYHRAMNRRRYLTRRQHYSTQELDEQQISGRQQPLIDEITARNLLRRLREQLSAEQMQTLELHFFEGYSLREIAEMTAQKLGNVRHHFYRGLERLRSNLSTRTE